MSVATGGGDGGGAGKEQRATSGDGGSRPHCERARARVQPS